MNHYDPGWHKFEPTRDEVLADLRAEERRARRPSRLGGMVARLPSPVRIVLPFVCGLALPLAGLALAFGAFVQPNSQPRALSIHVLVVTEGAPPIRIDRSSIVLTFSRSDLATETLTVTNLSPDTSAELSLRWSLPRGVLVGTARYDQLRPDATLGLPISVYLGPPHGSHEITLTIVTTPAGPANGN
jgi:hypothetical protein